MQPDNTRFVRRSFRQRLNSRLVLNFATRHRLYRFFEEHFVEQYSERPFLKRSLPHVGCPQIRIREISFATSCIAVAMKQSLSGPPKVKRVPELLGWADTSKTSAWFCALQE